MPNVPSIRNALSRGTTRASARRALAALAQSVASPSGDVANPTASTIASSGCGLVATGAQAAGAALTDQAITWDQQSFGASSYYSAGNPTRITVPVAGLYLVQCRAGIVIPRAAVVRYDLCRLRLKVNTGALYPIQVESNLLNSIADNATDQDAYVCLGGIILMAAGDYFEAILRTTLGGESLIVAFGGVSPATAIEVSCLGAS